MTREQVRVTQSALGILLTVRKDLESEFGVAGSKDYQMTAVDRAISSAMYTLRSLLFEHIKAKR